MERLIIDIALVIVAIGMGYWMGYRACFDYLMQEKDLNNLFYIAMIIILVLMLILAD